MKSVFANYCLFTVTWRRYGDTIAIPVPNHRTGTVLIRMFDFLVLRRSIGRSNKLFFCRYFIFPLLLNTNVLLDNRRDMRYPDQSPWWCLFVICFAELHSHCQAVHCRTGMHHHGGLPGPASNVIFSNTNLLPSSQRLHEFGHFLSVVCGAPLGNDPETRLPGWLFPAH